MEPQTSLIEPLLERVEAYARTTLELSKLKAIETMIMVTTSLLSRLGVVVILSLFLLILNIGIALFLGELLGKFYYGFFIVASFYLIAGIVFHYYLDNWIRKPISDLIISKLEN